MGQLILTYRVDCDASPAEVDEICEHVQRTSPVPDILRNPVSVTVTRETTPVASRRP